MSVYTALGLMSGTSLDGIDAAIIRTDGAAIIETGAARVTPYTPAQKTFARRAIKAAIEGRDSAAEIDEAKTHLTKANAAAARALMEESGTGADVLDIIGYHGQTILHRPRRSPEGRGRSWQLGDAGLLAELTGVDVAYDFRARDLDEGGEGAPLAPVYHAARVSALGRDHPVAVVNIGGVANVTYVAPDCAESDLISFDCGPGCGLLDAWMEMRTDAAFDEGGATALSGRAREDVARLMLLHPFIRRAPPKSADRYDFKLSPVDGLSVEDGAATLALVTARAIASSARFFPSPVGEWIICGGGRRNAAILAALEIELDAPVTAAEEIGWRGDVLEAECFAYLAVRALLGAPITFPGTTGAPRPLPGGVVRKAPK